MRQLLKKSINVMFLKDVKEYLTFKVLNLGKVTVIYFKYA